jgi:hypothetical protein
MRPERSRLTSRQARVARARVVLKAELDWIPGYPVAAASGRVVWRVPPGGSSERDVEIDRASLHHATRALTELETRFGDVLDDVLASPRAHCAGVRAVLHRLKPLVHDASRESDSSAIDEAALDARVYRDDIVRAVRSAPPAVRRVLGHAAWICAVAPERFAPIVTWARAHEALIALLAEQGDRGIDAATRLALLAGEEGERVAPLAHILAACLEHDVPTQGEEYARHIQRCLEREWRVTPRTARTLDDALAACIGQLLASDTHARRSALAILEALDLAPLLEQWGAWWKRLERCERIARVDTAPEHHETRRPFAKEAQRLAERHPTDLTGRELRDLVSGVLVWSPPTQRAVVRALGVLPAWEGAKPVRLGFLSHWVAVARESGEGALVASLRGFARYWAIAGAHPRRLAPWRRALRRRLSRARTLRALDSRLGDDRDAKTVARFYEALAHAVVEAGDADDGEEDDAPLAEVIGLLALVLPLADSAAHAATLARALAARSFRAYEEDTLREAFALADGKIEALAPIAEVLGSMARDEQRDVVRALSAARRAWGPALGRELFGEARAALAACGAHLTTLAMLGIAPPRVEPDAGETAWIAEYPAWVAPPLRALAQADPAAERTVRRLLGDDVRTAAAVRRELVHLEERAVESARRPRSPDSARGSKSRIAQRIANLRARLEQGSTVAPARRARLVAKMDRAARRAKLARLDEAAIALLHTKLPAFLGIEAAPAWLLEPRTVAKVAPISSFSEGMRKVARKVLAARAGAPPWDLRAEPANRAFLDRLTRAGVNVAPWLDGVGTRDATTDDGRVLSLRLEDDPLDILEMGQHFATCLSIGRFNYFSAFANAADVNKRVLYARTQDGVVFGRCLLALTDAGALLGFHPYAHAKRGFDRIVRDFVADLATKMGVSVVPTGRVARLVSTDWYDDGPVDLCGSFAFLAVGSAFRRALPTTPAATFAADLGRAFAPLPLGAIALPLVVALPEVEARPDLLLALVPHLESTRDLSVETLGAAAHLLARAGEEGALARLAPRIVEAVRAALARGGDHAIETLGAVIELAPTEGLRTLRATRERGVRRWEEEKDPKRIEMAARAYAALRRLHQAIALYRVAASRAGSGTWQRTLLERATELEKRLATEARPRPRQQ